MYVSFWEVARFGHQTARYGFRLTPGDLGPAPPLKTRLVLGVAATPYFRETDGFSTVGTDIVIALSRGRSCAHMMGEVLGGRDVAVGESAPGASDGGGCKGKPSGAIRTGMFPCSPASCLA